MLPLAAQSRAVLTGPIDETKLRTLAGNTRPEANTANDRGLVPDNLAMDHLLLQLQRSPEQQKAVDALIDNLHNPKSPDYHHWLTAAEFGQRYGLAPQDLTTITGWLQSHGFTVNSVYTNGLLIDFSGTAGQVRQAFHTEIHVSERGRRAAHRQHERSADSRGSRAGRRGRCLYERFPSARDGKETRRLHLQLRRIRL